MRTNQGYTIIKKAPVQDKIGDEWVTRYEIVLGINERKDMFVTWYVDPRGTYYHGHYTTTLTQAVIDFYERIAIEAQWNKPIQKN